MTTITMKSLLSMGDKRLMWNTIKSEDGNFSQNWSERLTKRLEWHKIRLINFNKFNKQPRKYFKIPLNTSKITTSNGGITECSFLDIQHFYLTATANICLFKVNNRNTTKGVKSVQISLQRHHNNVRFSVFIVNFE